MCVGNISQWGEVKKKTKDRSQSKVKEAGIRAGDPSNTSSRGGRGRGGADARGGRGRGSDRGRGTTRGGRAGSTANGFRNATTDKGLDDSTVTGNGGGWDEVPKTDGVTGGWDQPGEPDTTPLESSWEHVAASEATPAPTPAVEAPKPLKPDGTRSWASMFSNPAPAPVAQKPPQPAVQEAEIEPPAIEEPMEEDMPGLPPPISVEHAQTETSATPPTSATELSEPALEITPSKDLLTETNLEQLPDTSEPAPVATAASTVASTIDQRTAAGSNTPLHASQQPASRPPMNGYALSAYKATGGTGRSASYNRRLAEQQEAVVMPSKQSVDRAAVQFGSMGLNGTTEDGDVDSDREEPETRAQPPQHSPIAPRASLPPASQASSLLSQPLAGETLPTPRQAPGLPPVSQQSVQASLPDQAIQQPSQSGYPYNQYGRYGSQHTPHDTAAPTQKPYEPFGQQIQQHPQYDGYPSTSQPESQGQSQQPPSQMGNYSSAPNEMSSFYTSDGQRNAYQNYYNGYAQQPQQTQQESGSTQQRVGSAFGTSASEQAPQYATSHQPASRYGQGTEAQTSGQSTPNTTAPNQQPPQSQPGQSMQQQGQAGSQQHGGYPYGHPSYAYGSPYGYYNQHVSNHPYGRDRPMFDDVRRYDDQYLTHNPQFGYGGNQGAYGGGPFGGGAGGKQGMYGQPHQGYPQSAYDQHSSSPANVGGFGQHTAPSRDGGPTSAGLGNYGRTGSTHPAEGQQAYGASGGYGNVPDVFGRSQSGYPGSNHQQQGGQQGGSGNTNANEDSLRAYDPASKGPNGPSPALGQPGGGRPGSAVSGMQQNAPPQGHGQSQQGFGGYPGQHQMHGQQASGYGASPGGLGGHHQSGGQSHQGSGYGAYGAGFGSYYGNNRGGWAGNYGH